MLGKYVSKGPGNYFFFESPRDGPREHSESIQFKSGFFQLTLLHRRRQQTVRAVRH
jgi:hypothetical protein